MSDWLKKFGKSLNNEEQEESSVLFHEEEEDAEVPDTAFDTTDRFSAKKVREGLAELSEDFAEPSFVKKHKKWFLGGGIAVASVALIIALFAVFSTLSNPLRNYTQFEVTKGNVIDAMPTEGTLEANARYAITSLVSGKVTESDLKVGDSVTAGQVLYKLDDTEAKLAVERAQNLLSRSKVAGTPTVSTNRIYATDSGTIHTMNIRSGSSVSYGQVVATIKKEDDTIVAVTSSVAGTVAGLHTSVGKTVTTNGLIATVTSTQTSSSQMTGSYDQKTSELDVKSAEAYLDNFTITSPIDGVIVEKNTNVGDNVGVTNLENPMMVVLDTSAMKFTFQVDEYRIREIENGMDVIVNAESLPNKSFAGKISRVSPEGVLNEEGKPMYEVDVTIDEPKELRTGMKVSAKVILASASNVMYIPQLALREADGENAVVLVKKTADELSGAVMDSNALDAALSYPWIEVPKGCKLVSVTYGVADGTNVEIVSGLKTGDVVVYNPSWEVIDLTPDTDEDADPATPVPTDSDAVAVDPTEGKTKKTDEENLSL